MTTLKDTATGVTMPYGKFRGKAIACVPLDYLQWFLTSCKARREVKNAIQEALNPQKFTVNAPLPVQELSDLAEAIEKTSQVLAVVIKKKSEKKKSERKRP